MTDPLVAWRATLADQGDITSLIDFLEWSREMLKLNEDSELKALFHPETGAMEFQLTKRQEENGPLRKIQLGAHSY
jgi:hypothetical protein